MRLEGNVEFGQDIRRHPEDCAREAVYQVRCTHIAGRTFLSLEIKRVIGVY